MRLGGSMSLVGVMITAVMEGMLLRGAGASWKHETLEFSSAFATQAGQWWWALHRRRMFVCHSAG